MPQRRDDRARDQPQPGRRGRDRAQEDERVRPRRRRVLVPGERVVARVGRDAVRVGAGTERHVLADHDRVEPGLLGLDRHPHERAEVARRREGPVLGEDQDETGRRRRRRPVSRSRRRAQPAALPECRSSSASLAGSRPSDGEHVQRDRGPPRSLRPRARGGWGSAPCRRSRRSPRRVTRMPTIAARTTLPKTSSSRSPNSRPPTGAGTPRPGRRRRTWRTTRRSRSSAGSQAARAACRSPPPPRSGSPAPPISRTIAPTGVPYFRDTAASGAGSRRSRAIANTPRVEATAAPTPTASMSRRTRPATRSSARTPSPARTPRRRRARTVGRRPPRGLVITDRSKPKPATST